MDEETGKPIRAQLGTAIAALGALRALAYLSAHEAAAAPGATVLADYKTVLAQLEHEALVTIAAAAAELRKPTVRDLVDSLWSAGPLTFPQIREAVAGAGASSGEIETLLNRLRNAGLLEEAAPPPLESDRALQAQTTLPPSGRGEVTRQILALPEGEAAPSAGAAGDVTASCSVLVTRQGRPWFEARAQARGIDLAERINGRF
jgi:hypothetical protein